MSQALPVKDGRCDRRRDSRKIAGKVVGKVSKTSGMWKEVYRLLMKEVWYSLE